MNESALEAIHNEHPPTPVDCLQAEIERQKCFVDDLRKMLEGCKGKKREEQKIHRKLAEIFMSVTDFEKAKQCLIVLEGES